MGTCISGGGGNVIHDFWYLGRGDEGDKILTCYTFDLFTLSVNIHKGTPSLRSKMLIISHKQLFQCFHAHFCSDFMKLDGFTS